MVDKAKKFGGGFGSMFATGESTAKRATQEQQKEIARQKQIEQTRLAEEQSEANKRIAMANKGGAGRRSLIRTSELGIQNNNRKTLG